jgi:acyl-CoA synthetase (AMP-forming)/AMP-acid ligase II
VNIALILQMAAEAAPDGIGLVCDNKRWSYGALHEAAMGAAVMVRRTGCQFVAVLDESSEATAIALFGAALAGVPYVPLNYRLADPDLAALLVRISPSLVVGDAERVEQLSTDGAHHTLSRQQFVDAAVEENGSQLSEDDGDGIAIQIFTSGTTAAPKAALLSHENLLSYILGTVDFGCAGEEESALVCVPPYHIAGIAALMSSIYAQRRIVLLPAFSPDTWLALARQERTTNAFVVPTMLSRIIQSIDKSAQPALPALKSLAYGGGKMPLELIERALELFPETGFTNAYGLTETSSTIALLGPDEHRHAFTSENSAVRARLASVGRALPTVEIEIRDEEGTRLPPGERGEIYVRGDQVSGEYRERSGLGADGWFPTRDAGWIDGEGYLFLAGRADDIIVRGGENISPGEIEDVLIAHPAIADIAAVAVPSLEWGETVGIAVTLNPDARAPAKRELRDIVRARLRSSRMPEHILFVDELPYNEMGKLLRREVRKLFER